MQRPQLVARLVTDVAGLAPGGQNHAAAQEWIHTSLAAPRRFADVHSNVVQAQYGSVVRRLVQHAAYDKADALRALCAHRFGSAALPTEALALLYHLGNASEMLRTPLPWPAGAAPPSLAAAEVRAEVVDASAPPPPVHWGFSEEEAEGGSDDDDGVGGDVDTPGNPAACATYDGGATAAESCPALHSFGAASRAPPHVPQLPALLRLDALGASLRDGPNYGGAGGGACDDGTCEVGAGDVAAPRRLRESLRALAACGGTEWADVAAKDAWAAASRGGAAPLPAAARRWWSGMRVRAGGSASAAGGAPGGGAAAALNALELLASRMARQRAFVALVSTTAEAPPAVRAFAEGLRREEAEARDRELWAIDAAVAARDTGGRAARAAGGRPTVLSLLQRLRAPGGWARRAAGVEELLLELSAGGACASLLSGRGLVDGDGAAAAAAQLVDALIARCAAAQLRGGADAEPLLRLWLRLLVATLRPYLRQLAQWVCTGWLPPSFAQLPVRAATPPPKKQDSEAYWSDSFTQRAPEAIPTALRPLAAQLTLAGKTREFLGRLPPSGLADANATTGGVAGGAPGAASLEAAFYLRMLEAVRAAADGAKVPRTRAEEAAAHIRGPTPTASRGAVAVGAATWTPGHPLLPRAGRDTVAPSVAAAVAVAVSGQEKTEDGHGPSAMRSSTGLHLLAPAPRARGADEHFAAAASSLCALSPSAAASSDGDCVGQGSAGATASDALRAAAALCRTLREPPSAVTAGWAAQGGGGTQSSTRAFFAAKEVCSQQPPPCPPSPAPSLPRRLPPLPMLLEYCLLAPLRAECAAAEPEFLSAVSAVARPFEAAEMLQRVFLFGEPSLTADFLDALFTQLQADGPWRRRLPELSARLHDTLLSGGGDAHYARAFSLVHLGHSDSGARESRGDDALDILALDSLHITFEHEFPLQLVLSSRALQLHHEVFALLLRLRRARWALEAPLATALDAVGVQRFSAALASHSWLVLRASLRHLVCQLYAHFAQGVIEAEWARFRAAAAAARGVDAFRCAHEAFIVRVAEGCLLMPRFAPTLHAMKELLALTLRLRWQFESLPARRAATGAPQLAVAARWQAEVHRGVRYVLDAVRSEAPELLDVVDFNGFWLSPKEA